MRTRTGLLLGVLLTLAIAGCGKESGGDGVATAGGDKSAGANASAGPSLDPEERRLKWQQCLRDEGVDIEVESTDGRNNVKVSPGPDSDPKKVQAAMEKCKQYGPGGGDLGRDDPAAQEAMRNFAKCMRDNGVPNFPDPQPNGGMMIGQDSGIDPESDTFKAAQRKCEALMPRPSVRATR
jgi:hypothetical protein